MAIQRATSGSTTTRPAGPTAQEIAAAQRAADLKKAQEGMRVVQAIQEFLDVSYVIGKQAQATRQASTGGGGGGGGGGAAPAPMVQQAPAQLATPPQFANWEEAAKELYGGYYAIVQSVPELQGLLRQAYNEKWSTARFEYEIKQTSWWKNNSDTTRQWDMMSQMDPATARQQVQNRTSEMLAMSLEQFGVSFSAGQLSKLATDSLRFGWSQQTLLNAIGLEATKSQRGMSQLAQGFIGQGIKATAYQYGLNLADNTFNQWIVDIASGKQARQGFTSYALQTAKTLYKGIASQLDAGLTFQQIVDPYRNYASQILELNPETISFIDPKWTRAVNFTDDKGQVRAMGLDEWGDYLRQDKQFGYEYTSQAQQRAYQVVNNLANLFGKA